MRNLRIVGRSLLRFSGEDPLPLTATAWDAASNSVICAFGPSESRAVIDLKRLHYGRNESEDKLETISSWDAPCPLPSLACDSILNLHQFSDSSTTCLVLAGGDIILVREHPISNEEAVEIVGSVDAGISAAAWSPDEELLAITTEADTLLLMTRDIENVASIMLTPDDVKVSSHVSVGWGKKETQFKGKRAKALQDPTVPEHVDEGVLSPFDNRSVTISWRGDGAYFAVNKVEEERRRMIRVFSREGQLDSVSEAVDGLEGALSWRPSGNLIAGIRRLEDRVEVVFFERNGLRHGQFDLRFTPEEIKNTTVPLTLQWNSDSNVLAVCYPAKVQLWTMSNYHYYLKQELVVPNTSTTGVLCNWHAEKPLSMALSTHSHLQILEYLFTAVSGSVAPPNDFGLVPSIDGLSLKLTPLRVANTPPPMSLHQLVLEHKSIDVAVSMSSNRLAVLSESGIAVYALDMRKRPVPAPKLLWRSSSLQGHQPRHVAFVGDEEIFALTDNWDTEHGCLWKSEGQDFVPLGPIELPGHISSIMPSVDYQSIYVQFQDGSLYRVRQEALPDTLSIRFGLVNKFPSFAPEVRVINQDDQAIAFGLTKSGVLYANERILVRNCTSYIVTPAHLIFTTAPHLLKFVHLTTNENDLEVPSDEPQKDERCRSIERGARLVTAIPTTYSVVLQMPRGNLETIYPRALVLAAIRRSIEAERYAEAFLACRSQRVDMNILHDHDPDGFMKNIENIARQIKRVDHIDLLLSQLRNEDVSETMYKETIKTKGPDNSKSPQLPIDTKVNRICDAFLAVLERSEYKEAHLQNIITAHVSKVPADLEAGLEMIGRLQASQSPLTEKAAEHICFLADINQLYDTSLGIYNLELALLIAQQSQKDPREYLPHLQSLHDLSPLRRKFAIDDQLGRREKALQHLQDLDVFDEVQDYVVKHELYSAALEIYQYNKDRLNQITRLYAEHLSKTNAHKDAALAYEYLANYSAAYSAWLSSGPASWRETLYCATLSGMSEVEITKLATELCDGLTEAKDWGAASTLALEYLRDVRSAAGLLCKGNFFAEAMRIVALHKTKQKTRQRPTSTTSSPTSTAPETDASIQDQNQNHDDNTNTNSNEEEEEEDDDDLLTHLIDPALTLSSASMTEFLADMKSQLSLQLPRLRELRLKKSLDPTSYYDAPFSNPQDGADIPDNISLAPTQTTSGGTFMTQYTHRSNTTGTMASNVTRKTSKKKAREERKRARGKKGTVYEEEYLVHSLERLIERFNATTDEIRRLVEGLVRRGMRERARAVERSVMEVGGMCEGVVAELYVNETSGGGMEAGGNGGGGQGGEGGLKPVGGDATLVASLEEVSRKREPPVVKKFARLSLLGGP
ncbi:elongator complex protein 1 [Clohesyomyces aquaticus]|uniref:Elongator complex protein 1 n=1 Tax=Clohesyomyces aquaticus TaxID=1231657 RepID=A0A1Y1ZLJ2_9PLEO|nr:elongator complex protein 1 [Clohesyomyces aquaticus]